MKKLTVSNGKVCIIKCGEGSVVIGPGNNYFIPFLVAGTIEPSNEELVDFNEESYIRDFVKEHQIKGALSSVLTHVIGYNDIYGSDNITWIDPTITCNIKNNIKSLPAEEVIQHYINTIRLLVDIGIIDKSIYMDLKNVDGNVELNDSLFNILSLVNDKLGGYKTKFAKTTKFIPAIVARFNGFSNESIGVNDTDLAIDYVEGKDYLIPVVDKFYGDLSQFKLDESLNEEKYLESFFTNLNRRKVAEQVKNLLMADKFDKSKKDKTLQLINSLVFKSEVLDSYIKGNSDMRPYRIFDEIDSCSTQDMNMF